MDIKRNSISGSSNLDKINEDFYHTMSAIWDILRASERFYRWNIPQPKEQLIVNGYNEVILPITKLLHTDSLRRGTLAAINMDMETAKEHTIKSLYTNRYKDLINNRDKTKLAKSLVRVKEFSI